MPDSTQNLVFKLIIDGKEAVATLDVVSGKFTLTGEAAEQMSAEMVKAYTELISEALKYDVVNEVNIKTLQEFVAAKGMTIEQIENSIHALDAETAKLGINTLEWNKGMAASANLKAALGGVIQQQTGMTSAMHTGVPGVNHMRMAMHQFGYVLNDAQMFMVNARMGLMGIANNIPMIVQLMQQAKQAAGEKANMMQLLTKSLMGGGGLIIGINALMLLLQVLPGLFDKSTEGVKENVKELGELLKKIKELEKEIPGFDYSSIEMSFEKQNEYNKVVDESIEKVKKLRDEKEKEVKLLSEPVTRVVKGEPIVTQRADTKEIEKAKNELADYNNQLKELTKSKEFFNSLLDRTQGKLIGLDERIKTQSVSSEEWKNLISKMTDNEIKALVGSLDKSNSGVQRGSEEYKTATSNLERLRSEMNKYSTSLKAGDTDKFAESHAKAVEKFILDGFKKNEAARLANMEYIPLLEELEQVEKEHASAIENIKNSKNQKELDVNVKQAEIEEIRIKLIGDAIDKQEKLTSEELADWRKKRDEILKYQEQMLDDRKKFEEDKAKFFNELDIQLAPSETKRQEKELEQEEQLTIERAKMYGASEEMITNIKRYYENERLKIAEEAHFQELDLLQDKINQISSAYSQIFNIIASGVRDEIDVWKNKEEEKIEKERDSALSHAKTQQQREKINEQFDKRKEAIEKEADKKAQARLETWFNLQKALAVAEIGINLSKAISVEWGKLGTFALITQGIVIGALTAQMYAVANQKFPKGFAEGGRLPAGKAGIIEGTHNELIAPEEDFKTIFKTYSADLVRHALIDYRISSGASSGLSSSELKEIKEELTGLKSTVNKLNNILDEGIDARAVYDEDAAERIYLKGRGCYRRSKI